MPRMASRTKNHERGPVGGIVRKMRYIQQPVRGAAVLADVAGGFEQHKTQAPPAGIVILPILRSNWHMRPLVIPTYSDVPAFVKTGCRVECTMEFTASTNCTATFGASKH